MAKRWMSSVCLAVLFLTGCLQTNVIDEVSLIRSAAYDLDDEQQLKITVSFPTFIEQGGKNVLEKGIIEASGDTAKGTKVMLNKRAQRPLVLGQIRVILFSRELAEQGIEDLVDSLYRDPSVGNRILLAVVDGRAEEVLKTELGSGEQAGVFLSDLLRQNMEQNMIPSTNLHNFLFSFYSDARDPYLPLIKKAGDTVRVAGTALFKADVVHTTLSGDDSFLLKLLTTPARQATQQFTLNGEGATSHVVIEKLNSELKKEVEKTETGPIFRYNMTIDGEIIDYTGEMNLDEPGVVKEVQEKIEEEITRRLTDMLYQFRDEGIDPVGVGELYRSTTRDWRPEEWENSIYPAATFELDIELNVIQSGAIE
ncbi:Ger(x)C family spore germination protein [Alkalihalobacillus oceani]|uniref:Ger(X)C family spore germination protein n=1 Tax=Halalkalibacter oceani TaxID=1653776 RepID=A0A9X2IPK2_9BACI|nr:Ger(x)C family spore germination protein [Halalkalibacter oceani]MCM3713648.1 Ger(x)C family spore germination protein [Halalkalibacter oceani]